MMRILLGSFVTNLFSQVLIAVVRIEEATNAPPIVPVTYSLHDLGQTDVEASAMGAFALPHSYAPRINNAGVVIANRLNEGYLRDLSHGELTPQIGYYLRGQTYGLNDDGTFISTLGRSKDNIDWYIWTQNNLRRQKRYAVIPFEKISGTNLDLRKINQHNWAVGSYQLDGEFRPIIWDPNHELKSLGYYLGWDFKGAAFDINSQGSILGYMQEGDYNLPFVWHEKHGLDILRDYKIPLETQTTHKISGPVHFADMVITEDNFVYGNFWVKNPKYHDHEKRNYQAYRWEPASKDLRALDLQGMRINSVNKKHTLVGAIDGEAVVRERGAKPYLLKNLIKDDAWVFLEATDINDRGDIVGYGKYQGHLHVFLLKKET